MGTVMQDRQQRHADRPRRWDRTQRAALCDQYLDLEAKGFSLRQAAQAREVPRSTLGAWRAPHESLDAHPAVVAFFHRGPGRACLHRLMFAIHLGGTDVGACGMRLGCLLGQLTSLDRFVAASYGAQQPINRQVEAAIVAS